MKIKFIENSKNTKILVDKNSLILGIKFNQFTKKDLGFILYKNNTKFKPTILNV